MLKRKTIFCILCTCFVALVLTGCGNKIPEMTEEQYSLVTEYAAGLLLEYHADYQSKLVDTSVPPTEMNAQLSEEQPAEQTEQTEQTEQVSVNSTSDTEGADAEDGVASGEDLMSSQTVTSQLTVSQVLGLQDFDISYTGYEVCDSYPNEQTSEDDLFFAMQAGEGNKLVVLKLQIANSKEQEQPINMLEISDAKSRVVLNGQKHNVLITMLDNDFMTLEQVVAPGAAMEAVVIAEVSAEEAEQLQTVKFYIENGEKSTTVG